MRTLLLTFVISMIIGASTAVATDLGVVYHVPDTGDIKAEIAAMSEAGITAIMIGGSPYASDWPRLREAVRHAEAHGMKVSLLTSTDWFPGRYYDGISSVQIEPDGSKGLGFSYSCMPAAEDVGEAVRKFIRRFRLHNNVQYLTLVNEVWAWEDHSVWAERGFRDYLRGLNPDIGYWNGRWGTKLTSFDGIELSALPDKGTLRNDFDIYRSDAYARFYATVFQKAKSAAPAHWLISGQKLYPNYYSNHSTDSRWACLDFYKLFRQHRSNDAWSCHEYGWGSIAAKASKARTVRGLWRRPVVVTESWGGATDDKAVAQGRWDKTLRVFRMTKAVYDPEVVFIYQWKWIEDKPEWLRQLKEEIVPLLKQELGVPVFDDVGILDARAAHYDFDPSTEESYWAVNEAAGSAGLLPVQVYMDESQAYSLGRSAFDSMPSVLLVPHDRGLYPDSIYDGYEGAVLRYGPGKPAASAVREAVTKAGVRPIIEAAVKPAGVYEQLYRGDGRHILAVYNSTAETAKVSYHIELDRTPHNAPNVTHSPYRTTVTWSRKIGDGTRRVEAEIPAYGIGIYRL